MKIKYGLYKDGIPEDSFHLIDIPDSTFRYCETEEEQDKVIDDRIYAEINRAYYWWEKV